MRSIAYLVSADVHPNSPCRREDAYEVDLQLDALRGPCRARALQLEPVVWDDPQVDWSSYDAAVIAATWDYMDKSAAFLAALDQIAAATALFNAPSVARWNIDKGYMADLAARGVATVPTLARERADPDVLMAAFDALASDEIVVKPRVGAGAWRQARLRRGEPLPAPSALPPGACLIQPFMASVAREGEISFIFYDGAFSHALRKRPAAGDYRVQSIYGGREEVFEPSLADLAIAAHGVEQAARLLGRRLLYGRADYVWDAAGALTLMELELIEPYHYPEQGPGCGDRFAAALDTLLAG